MPPAPPASQHFSIAPALMENCLEEQDDPFAAAVGWSGANSPQAPDSEPDAFDEPAAKRGKFIWTDHRELSRIVAAQRHDRGSLRSGGGVQAGFEDLQRLVEEANVQRAAAGEQPICIPDSLTLQAYQTKFNRSAAAGGSRKRGRSGASSRQLATQAVPPAPPQQQQLQQQQQRQQASGGGQGRQPAVGARTAANGSSAHASVDDGSGDSAQEDAAPIDLVGARLAVMALIRHMFAVLGKFPWLQLFIAADFPGNKLLMDGG